DAVLGAPLAQARLLGRFLVLEPLLQLALALEQSLELAVGAAMPEETDDRLDILRQSLEREPDRQVAPEVEVGLARQRKIGTGLEVVRNILRVAIIGVGREVNGASLQAEIGLDLFHSPEGGEFECRENIVEFCGHHDSSLRASCVADSNPCRSPGPRCGKSAEGVVRTRIAASLAPTATARR